MERRDFELVLATDLIAAALRRLSGQPDQIAIGSIRVDSTRRPIGLIVEELSRSVAVRSEVNSGWDFAPLADWIAVAMPTRSAPNQPDEWIQRLKPMYSQTLVLLLLGFGPSRADWRGWVIHRGESRPLHALTGVGGHAFRIATTAEPEAVGAECTDITDLEGRWSRAELALGEQTFRQLQDTTVVVIGCSGVGCHVAMHLAALPIRRLGLIDGDTIETHNLIRMPLATEADIGLNKAMVVARRVSNMRSDLAIKVSDKPFGTKLDEPVTHGMHLLVTAVDCDAPRLRASYLARQRMVPHLDIGTSVTQDSLGERLLAADVRFLVPRSGCIRCVGGLGQLDAAEFELNAPRGALPLQAPEAWNARGRLGSLATINSLAATTAVQLWLDMLERNSLKSTWHRIRWDTQIGWKSDGAAVSSGPDCKICKKSFAA